MMKIGRLEIKARWPIAWRLIPRTYSVPPGDFEVPACLGPPFGTKSQDRGCCFVGFRDVKHGEGCREIDAKKAGWDEDRENRERGVCQPNVYEKYVSSSPKTLTLKYSGHPRQRYHADGERPPCLPQVGGHPTTFYAKDDCCYFVGDRTAIHIEGCPALEEKT